MNSSAPKPGVGPDTALTELEQSNAFVDRHIGPDVSEIHSMLAELGEDSLEALVDDIVPADIALGRPLALPDALDEEQALQHLQDMLAEDRPGRSLIGLGYYDTFTPRVIQRNVLENPAWYTAYTPYQSEISQGRLESLLNYQQMTMDLTGMDLANASLLDEATAAAEGMALARRVCRQEEAKQFFVDARCLPQTLAVLRTRASGLDIELIIADPEEMPESGLFGGLFQYPAADGEVRDLTPYIEKLHAQKAISVVAADLMALVLLKPPGEMGADVVVGTTQRFGVPMGYGGPHAAYMATRDAYRRSVPGRLIGVSRDSRGKMAARMALQTREQHIRREKANSNICTAQVLLANMAALYAMYHGPEGLRSIASRIHRLTRILVEGLRRQGMKPVHNQYFDTVSFSVPADIGQAIHKRALAEDLHLRWDDEQCKQFGLSLDECSDRQEVERLWRVLLGEESCAALAVDVIDADLSAADGLPADLRRQSEFLTHAHFNDYHSETEMLRYLKRLEERDISLTRSMIPLGSCTMKLNATTEMLPISWPAINKVHPFIPRDCVPGYQAMLSDFESLLAEITGFDAVSLQPNSGAQGEYAGLIAIRRYLDSRGEEARDICLIPQSAHGTNPASAHMVGMEVVMVACDEQGNVDVADLKEKAAAHKERLAALMLTYPSTHGVFEEEVRQLCEVVHANGGQVYLDGANLNAMVGVARPGDFGADVCHVNLHKTFCIPHGGGGPGMGPIGVKKHLTPYLPDHPMTPRTTPTDDTGAVSAAAWGSASIIPISWLYIRMMGGEGLTQATRVAILNANYIAHRLSEHYPVLYTGRSGRVAHECIIDMRGFKQSAGIAEGDVAKRLIDFGFHAPTMSFPVPGTLMIEPTESENRAELDRFIDAMVLIRQEIAAIENGEVDREDNPLKNAPHTEADILAEEWPHAYSRRQAVYPAEWVARHKYWPPVNRVDDVYGDRNLMCGCPPMEAYT